MASLKNRAPPEVDQREPKRPKPSDSSNIDAESHRVVLNPADCNLDFDIQGNGLQGHALCEKGFAYCWSGARANFGITGGKYCFGCKIISAQPVQMEDTPPDQQHVCRVGLSRGDDSVGSLGESQHSFGFGGTGKFSNSGKFSDFGTKFGVGDTIVCAVNLENKPMAFIGFSKNGKWLGTAKHFDAGPRGLGVVGSPMRDLPWESALFPHVLLKNVVVELQFCMEDGLIPEEGYKPWTSSLGDGNAIMGPAFSSPKECEVFMMVGLPASGKTTWAENWAKEHPEKRYILLGTNLALDQMKVPGLLRKCNYGERFDRLMDRATGIFNTLLGRAAKTPRNYILDQTNVYKSARKRKLKAFVNYRKIAVVIFPNADELKFRAKKRFEEMGKEVPPEAVNEMLANYVLPMSKDMPGADEFFEEVIFPELNRAEAQRCLEDMKRALDSASISNEKSDFSPYSRESSVQSYSNRLPQNKESVSDVRDWKSPHSVRSPEYNFRYAQRVGSDHSRFGSHLKDEFSSGGHRPDLGETGGFYSRESPVGNHSYYTGYPPRSGPDPVGSYGGHDPFNTPVGDSRNSTPDSKRRPISADADSCSSYSASNHYGSPNFRSPGAQSNFGGSPSYRSPVTHMGNYGMDMADLHGARGSPLGLRPPLYSPGSYVSPPPKPPHGNFPPAEQYRGGGYPPPGPRYY